MRAMAAAALAVWAAAAPAAGPSKETLLTADEVREAFRNLPKTPPTNREVIVERHYTVKAARVENRDGPVELHRDQDRVFLIQEGRAVMRVGGELESPEELSPGEWRAKRSRGYREVPLEPGSVLSVPRGVAYQIVATGMDVRFLVIAVR